MSEQGGGGGGGLREYGKGNWTVGEAMVLIEAKKMDDERRLKSKPTELRWKWVEDYCWRKGCLRSQNQCNDKWDNLMRDYKKVREHERRVMAMAENGGGEVQGSYWSIDKTQRKLHNLPSNMLPQIYKALVEAVETKASPSIGCVVVDDKGGFNGATGNGMLLQTPIQQQPLLKHHYICAPIPIPFPIPPVATPAQPPPLLPCPQPLPTMCGSSDSSGTKESPAKRKRRGEGTSESGSGSSIDEVGTAISKSASIIAEALQECEDREETRHRELLSLREKRLRVEESNAEVNRQGIDGLVDAINKLANSIHALASYKNQPPK